MAKPTVLAPPGRRPPAEPAAAAGTGNRPWSAAACLGHWTGRPEPDGRFDLALAVERWYPMPAHNRDHLAERPSRPSIVLEVR